MEPLNTEDASVQKKQNRDEIQKATGENRRKKNNQNGAPNTSSDPNQETPGNATPKKLVRHKLHSIREKWLDRTYQFDPLAKA